MEYLSDFPSQFIVIFCIPLFNNPYQYHIVLIYAVLSVSYVYYNELACIL